MEYFTRLLSSRSTSSSGSSSASSSTTLGPSSSSTRSGFLRAVAGTGSASSSPSDSYRPSFRSRQSTSSSITSHSSASDSSRNTLDAFVKDWEAVKSTLTTPDQRALHYGISRSDVPLLLERMADALILESSSFTPSEHTTDIPPCMEHLLRSSLLDILVQLSLPNKPKGSLAEAIRFFSHLIVDLDESFVSRQAVHRPLARLIRGCVGDEDGDDLERLRSLGLDFGDDDDDDDFDGNVDDDDEGRPRRTRSRYGRINSVEAVTFEQDLVDLMAHIAARIKSAPELLLIFFHDERKSSQHDQEGLSEHHPHSNPPQTPPPLSASTSVPSPYFTFLGEDAKPEFPLFSYLLRFIHREGILGELARAGLLNLVTVALGPEPISIGQSQDQMGSRGTIKKKGKKKKGGRDADADDSIPPPPPQSIASSARQALAAFILDSDFADVLGAGLGAVYGLLPTKLVLLRPSPATEDQQGAGVTVRVASEGGAAASMLGSEGMRLGGSSSSGSQQSSSSHSVDAHFLLDEFAAAAEEDPSVSLPERLRQAGIATSQDAEVQSQVRLLVLLLDFTQDVLGTAAEAIYRDSIISSAGGVSAAAPSAMSIASALSLAVVRAVRSIFLQNVVYPSMLECSDVDGSATAVMAYLDVILSVIDDRSILADVVVGYLVGATEAVSSLERQWADAAARANEDEGADYEDEDEDEEEDVIRLEGGNPTPRRKRSASSFSSSSTATATASNQAGSKARRRRSTALRLVQEDSRAGSNNRWGGLIDNGDGELAFAYNASDDAFGRYTLKDLILAHLEESSLLSHTGHRKRGKKGRAGKGGRRRSGSLGTMKKISAQARQAALRLLRTVLAEHGRFTMGNAEDGGADALVGCVKEEGATSFPSFLTGSASLALLDAAAAASAGGATSAAVVAPGQNGGSQAEAWPDEVGGKGLLKLDDDLSTPFSNGFSGASFGDEAQLWGGGGGGGETNVNGSSGSNLALKANSIGGTDGNRTSAVEKAKAVSTSNGMVAVATITLDAHLHELALYSYLVGTLRAIVEVPAAAAKPQGANRSIAGIQASSYERYLEDGADLLSLDSTYLYGLEADKSPLTPDVEQQQVQLPSSPFSHRLSPTTDPLLRTLVHALARFFSKSPESNLLLTGVLAALARCPYRSLEGWLTPTRQQAFGTGQDQEGGEQQLEEQFRSLGSFLNWSPTWISSSISGKAPADLTAADRETCPIILHVLLGLAAQVRRYARSIPDFSRYLRERREGLMFVENLNDALGLGGIGVEDDDGHLGFGDGTGDGSEPSTPTPTAARAGSGAASKSAGTAVVPPSKVPLALTSAVSTKNEDDDQTGLPPVLYWKTTPPEDAGRPGTTSLPSSKSKSNGSGAGRGKMAASARSKGGVLKRGSDPAVPDTSTNPNGVMVQPFARHYAETSSIFVGTVAVRLPAEWRGADGGDQEAAAAAAEAERRRIRIRFQDEEEDEDQDSDESEDSEDDDEDDETPTDTDEGSEDTTDASLRNNKRATSNAPRTLTSSIDSSNDGSGSSSPALPGTPKTTKGVLKKRRENHHVTLSALLDNVVILEQATMELLAVVQVRRCAGVDAVALINKTCERYDSFKKGDFSATAEIEPSIDPSKGGANAVPIAKLSNLIDFDDDSSGASASAAQSSSS
ncbi:hypothetical protein OC846_005450 [Tilletia horrida]|uniref:FHF complex subunit HOOK-interacting protein C-terminal domain-containing protein n=1 Tax=Tilletia horrida TaxID=155126 RepID=A0AAN6JRQ4_9BASI|nr:hypothetical protein OC846_005450 [Tilletia horrida]